MEDLNSPRFFETASHLYLSIRRKSLPHISGRLLLVPSSLKRGIRIYTQHSDGHTREILSTNLDIMAYAGGGYLCWTALDRTARSHSLNLELGETGIHGQLRLEYSVGQLELEYC
jgi:hypothetical protein